MKNFKNFKNFKILNKEELNSVKGGEEAWLIMSGPYYDDFGKEYYSVINNKTQTCYMYYHPE